MAKKTVAFVSDFCVLRSAFVGEQVNTPTVVQLPDDELTPTKRNSQQASTVYQLAATQVELERNTGDRFVALCRYVAGTSRR